mgnify:CR=1 FL=1
MMQKIDPAAAIRLLDAGKAVAVDVREPDEYAVGHIPPQRRRSAEAGEPRLREPVRPRRHPELAV